MIVVSDTSAISGLFFIDQLHLLPELFGKVILPKMVMQELTNLEKAGVDISRIKNAAWLEIVPAGDDREVARLLSFLDAGESEAIVLAIELQADYLIMDDLDGRKTAQLLGIPVLGLLGVLVLAKKAELIPAVKPLIEAIILRTKFRISPLLLQKVLADIGE